MKKQTMDQDFKARLVISLIIAGYYNSPLTKAIMAVDAKIKSIPADKARKMMFGVTFDKNLLIAKQYDFLDSFIENVVPLCQDVTMLKNMLGELVDVFMCNHGNDDFVNLERLMMTGGIRVPSTYTNVVSLLLTALRQSYHLKNQHQFESIVSLLAAARYDSFSVTLAIVESQLHKHGVRMAADEIMVVLQMLAGKMLRMPYHKHEQSDTQTDTPSEINVHIYINSHAHQPQVDSVTAFPVPGQGDETVATGCVSKPTRQTTIDLSASNFAFDYMDRLTDAIARGHKPSNIGIAAMVVKGTTSVVPSLRAIEVLLGNATYQTFDDARSKKEESLYNRFVNANFVNGIDELVTEIVLFAPMMFSPNRFIERLACLELHTNGAKYLR